MSGLVVDTHAALWYLRDLPKLSVAALAALDGATLAGDPIYLASISIVEVIYLVEKARVPPTALIALNEALAGPNPAFELVPLDLAVTQVLGQIPRNLVPDMPDRIITATALHLQLPLFTRDLKIQAATVNTIW